MSALPYLATIVVLVLISRARDTAGSAAPASLGTGVRAGPLDFAPGRARRAARLRASGYPVMNPESTS